MIKGGFIDAKFFHFGLPPEWHHLYTGLIIAAVGVWLDLEWLRAIGWIIAADDLGQHITQGSALKGSEYLSPLHVIFYAMFPWLS